MVGLCILVGYKSLLMVLNGNDIKMKMHFKIMKKVVLVQE